MLHPLERHLSRAVQLDKTEASWQGAAQTLAALSAQEADVDLQVARGLPWQAPLSVAGSIWEHFRIQIFKITNGWAWWYTINPQCLEGGGVWIFVSLRLACST